MIDVFFGSIFFNYSDFRRLPKMIVLFAELVGFPNIFFFGDVRFDVVFPKIFCAWFDSDRVGFPKCLIFPEVIKDNRRCAFRRARPRRICKDLLLRQRQFTELVGRPKMFDNVLFFSEVTQDVDP